MAIRILSVLLFFVVVHGSHAQSFGTVTGRVVDENNEPITGASVHVYQIASSDESFSLVTDSTGFFSRNGIPVGYYYLDVSYRDYTSCTSAEMHVYNRLRNDVTLVAFNGTCCFNSVHVLYEQPLFSNNPFHTTLYSAEELVSLSVR